MTRNETGADALCRALEAAGVRCVFGLPGTQTVGVFDSLRRSQIRTIVTTHELGATFMALGYARAAGAEGVVVTIPGPGFAYTIAGLAEAKLDGAAVVLFTLEPARGPTGEPGFQGIDQAAIARPLVKAVLTVTDRDALPGVVREALQLSRDAQPGPVLVQIAERVLFESGAAIDAPAHPVPPQPTGGFDGVIAEIAAAHHPVIFVASDCVLAADALRVVAEGGRIPVCVPPPFRGVLPEDNPWCLCFDDQRTQPGTLQEVLRQSDLVVVLGVRLSHVTTAGFRLALDAERVVCVAPHNGVLPHGYRARRTIEAEPRAFCEQLVAAGAFASQWTVDEVRALQDRCAKARPASPPETSIDGGPPERFFSSLRAGLPRNAVVVTDSGLHQVMVRRHLSVLAAGGLLIPSDFQSMGFALAAGIGAKLAAPKRPVLVVMGDGGFAMSGLELLTAAREKIPVVVVVFNDGKLNLIRVQQLGEFGTSHGVDLEGPDFEQFAASVGVRYRNVSRDIAQSMQEAFALSEPTLLEVRVGDSAAIRRVHAVSAIRGVVRRALGPRLLAWVKARLR